MLLIPYGRVSTYGAIAKALGAARSARTVGYALSRCPDFSYVPAHRVVNAQGLLTGKHHFPTPAYMAQMLQEEGVRVKKDQVLDFGRLFWDPQKPEL